ncbi:MAG: hypothetical protein HRT68_00525 [Flavobacteriaceae bacterium]|nr:hypothetical protein [Flavobacteriaceae bacterium]
MKKLIVLPVIILSLFIVACSSDDAKKVLVSVMTDGKKFVSKTNISKSDLNKYVREISGITVKNWDLISFTKSNDYVRFLDDLYIKIGDKPLHPKLKRRIELYIENIERSARNTDTRLFERGGKFPGEHAEVRALNELLHQIDPGNKISVEIFKNIFGVNRNIDSGKDMARCFHCSSITDLITILFVN